jgi:flagella basal body P-ring formation protein FlgA
MTRFAALLLFALLAAAGAAPVIAAPSLRAVASVDADVVRLGDLFDDAGPHAGDVVAPAPPPGSRTVFDAAWLSAMAREHQLDWQAASRFDQAVVERATRTIGADLVAQRLLQAIAQQQNVAGAELELDDPGLRLVVARSAGDSLDIERLAVDPRSGRFSAMVSGGDGEPQRVSGRLVRMTSLPALARPIAPGETIGAGDLETIKLRAERVSGDLVLDAHELIGKTPRHLLRAHEPVRGPDVETPLVVRKGDLVTIVLETATMRLTAQGKALEGGSRGAAIRIANTKSSRVIDAVVIGPNLVKVAPAGQLAAR